MIQYTQSLTYMTFTVPYDPYLINSEAQQISGWKLQIPISLILTLLTLILTFIYQTTAT